MPCVRARKITQILTVGHLEAKWTKRKGVALVHLGIFRPLPYKDRQSCLSAIGRALQPAGTLHFNPLTAEFYSLPACKQRSDCIYRHDIGTVSVQGVQVQSQHIYRTGFALWGGWMCDSTLPVFDPIISSQSKLHVQCQRPAGSSGVRPELVHTAGPVRAAK